MLISRSTHTYAYLPSDIYLCLSLVGHILIQISRMRYGAYTYAYMEVLIHILILISNLYLFQSPVRVTALIPIQRYLYTYGYLYLSQISRRSSQNLCLYIGTSGTTKFIRIP